MNTVLHIILLFEASYSYLTRASTLHVVYLVNILFVTFQMEMQLSVPFETDRLARIAYDALRVDPEPPRSGLQKRLDVDGDVLKVEFRSESAKSLRVGVNNFFESLKLVVNTQERFDPQR